MTENVSTQTLVFIQLEMWKMYLVKLELLIGSLLTLLGLPVLPLGFDSRDIICDISIVIVIGLDNEKDFKFTSWK